MDELVKKLAEVFENKPFSEILKINLQLTQKVLMHRILTILDDCRDRKVEIVIVPQNAQRNIKFSTIGFKVII